MCTFCLVWGLTSQSTSMVMSSRAARIRLPHDMIRMIQLSRYNKYHNEFLARKYVWMKKKSRCHSHKHDYLHGTPLNKCLKKWLSQHSQKIPIYIMNLPENCPKKSTYWEKIWAGVPLYIMIFIHPQPFSPSQQKVWVRERNWRSGWGTWNYWNLHQSTNSFKSDRQDGRDCQNNILPLMRRRRMTVHIISWSISTKV